MLVILSLLFACSTPDEAPVETIKAPPVASETEADDKMKLAIEREAAIQQVLNDRVRGLVAELEELEKLPKDSPDTAQRIDRAAERIETAQAEIAAQRERLEIMRKANADAMR